MANVQHIGNVKLSKAGKGLNIHIFNGNVFGTIPLDKAEKLIDEARINGASSIVIPIIHVENE